MTATHALRSPEPMVVLRYLDLALAAIALPVFVIAGWPLGGWITGAGAGARGVRTRLLLRRTASPR